MPQSNYVSSEEQQARKRRQVQNDAIMRDDLPIPPESNLARDGFTYEMYRVGSPPLQLLPLRNIDLPEDSQAYPVLRRLRPQIKEILEANGVELNLSSEGGWIRDIDFMYRTIEDEPPSQENLTIQIPAVWNDNAPFQWLHAIDELRSILVNDHRTRAVKVELIGVQLLETRSLEVVKADDPIVAIWDEMRPQIHSIIDQNEVLRDRWWSIGIVRMDYIRSDELLTTLSILVNWDVNPIQWQNTKSELKDLLRSYNVPDVRVNFARGEIRLNAFQLQKPAQGGKAGDILIETDYAEKVGMGASFGPARYYTKAPGQPADGPCGTFGGYLKATDKQTGKTKRMGLTSYHTTRQAIDGFSYTVGATDEAVEAPVPEGSDLETIDRQGMEPSFPGRQAMVFESPSRRKHNYTIESLEKNLQAGTTHAHAQRIQTEIDRGRAFFDEGNHILGTAWASSGHCQRTPENSRLDWALLEFTNLRRSASNTMPPANEWRNTMGSWGIDLALRPMEGIASCKVGYRVYKKGAYSGLTEGTINPLRHDVKLPTKDPTLGLGYSSEYVCIGRSAVLPQFTGPGDSGSIFFTSGGEVVGMLWGGSVNYQIRAGTMCYATDAEALLQALNERFQSAYTFEFAED